MTKKGALMSPRRRSILNRAVAVGQPQQQRDDDPNDDEAERAALLAEERSRSSHFSTPSSVASSRRSVVSEISSPQKEHYQGCLKLYAENKINKDNAWNLQLIDFMSAMLRKHDSRMENLQVASTTLDASARIYSFRVDGIHHDVLKMAGGLSKAVQAKRGKRTEDDADNINESMNNADAEGATQKKKEKRKRTAKSSLSTNVNSQLNMEIDVNECIDPFFAQLAATTGDTTSSNRAFNATLPIDDKNLGIILRSDVEFLSSCDNASEEKLNMSELEYFNVNKDLILSVKDDDRICTSFHGFSIKDWDPDDEDAQTFQNKKTSAWVDDLNLSQQNAAFDMNADVEPLPQSVTNDFIYDDPNDGVVSDEEEIGIMGQAIKRDKGRMIACLVDARPSTQSDIVLEYAYSNVVIGSWAGPSHWKLKNNVNKGSRLTEKSNTMTSVVTKKTASKKNKELDFIVEGMNFDRSQKCPQYATAVPAKIMLGRKTLVNGMAWNEKKFKTPVDRGLNMNHFRKFNLRQTVMLSLAFDKPEEKAEIARISDVMEYDYNNDNDTSYCPNSQPEDGACEPWIDEDGNIGDIHNQHEGNGGMEMVEPPPKVAKIFIPYALRAKKIDMKQLKNVTWKLLTFNDKLPDSDKENRDVTECESVLEINFTELYRKLPTKLSPNMRESLSIPLSLLAVLHLANEKGLILKNNAEYTDFSIRNLDKS